MKLPEIVIVGRPNVGKSTLFNRICGRNISIVHNADGITRDRIFGRGYCLNKNFSVVDTGGFLFGDKSDLNPLIENQVGIAVKTADVILIVVDGRTGISPADEDLARALILENRPIILCVNKLDYRPLNCEAYQFHKLGISSIYPISAAHGDGVYEVIEEAIKSFPENGNDVELADNSIKICVVGRTNAGKSTFVNAVLGNQRCVVSSIPGTTTDSIDSTMKWGETDVTLIDTAGIKKHSRRRECVDVFSFSRTERAIRRAEIVIVILDTEFGFSAHDKRIFSMVWNSGKGCVVFLNKWDLISGIAMEHCKTAISEEIPQKFPIIIGSALSGRNVNKCIESAISIGNSYRKKVGTRELNQFLSYVLDTNPPPIQGNGKRLKIYYITQTNFLPPTFIAFINDKRHVSKNWEKFFLKSLSNEFGFMGVPLKLCMKGKD